MTLLTAAKPLARKDNALIGRSLVRRCVLVMAECSSNKQPLAMI